jgi:hypothetical protein
VDVLEDRTSLKKLAKTLKGYKVFMISAITGEGTDALMDELAQIVF